MVKNKRDALLVSRSFIQAREKNAKQQDLHTICTWSSMCKKQRYTLSRDACKFINSFHGGKRRIAKMQLDNSDLVKGYIPCPYEMRLTGNSSIYVVKPEIN